MIKRIDISTVHTEMSKNLQKYITKKFSTLDTYIPKHARGSVHLEIILKESKSKEKKQCSVEAILHLPGENIAAKESTMNMFAAVDIVQEKLKVQLKKYKDAHTPAKTGQQNRKVRDFIGKIRTQRRLR